MRRYIQSLAAVLIPVILLVGLMLTLSWLPRTEASAAPNQAIQEWQFFNTNTRVTTTTNSAAINARDNNWVDVQLVVTMPTVSTATFQLYHSNDNLHWSPGAVIAADVATHTNVITSVRNLGVFTRLRATMTQTPSFTTTSRGMFYHTEVNQ